MVLGCRSKFFLLLAGGSYAVSILVELHPFSSLGKQEPRVGDLAASFPPGNGAAGGQLTSSA